MAVCRCGQIPPEQAEIRKKLRNAQPTFRAAITILMRCAQILGTSVMINMITAISMVKYPGLPQCVPSAATPLMTIFFLQ